MGSNTIWKKRGDDCHRIQTASILIQAASQERGLTDPISGPHLLNTQDTNFRTVSDNWPVCGLAHDLGNMSKASPVVFSVGNIRDPVLQYIVANDDSAKELAFLERISDPAALVSLFNFSRFVM